MSPEQQPDLEVPPEKARAAREPGLQQIAALDYPVELIPAQPGISVRFSALARTLLHPLGIDRPIAYTLIGRGWSLIAGLLTIGLIARFLRPEEQGFYYTFGSIIALYAFCELGLSFVLTQFASHEKAHLEWTNLKTLEGSERAKVRIAALLTRALQWYCAVAVVFLLLVLPAGLYFFSRNSVPNEHIAWRTPWIWLACVAVLNLCTLPFFAILEGCGKIAEIALVRTGQTVLANLGIWLALFMRTGLYSVAVYQGAFFLVGLVWLVAGYRGFFRDLLQLDVSEAPFHWRTEVWPFQWRMAVSSASNYLVFQTFAPVMFAAHGPIAAGQMGMSLSLCNALLNGSMAWMTTKASPFGVLVAKRQWKALDAVFFKTLKQSVLILLAGSFAACCGVAILHYFDYPISKRFLDTLPFAALLLATVISHAVFCEAQYLRTHKAEPFLRLSVISALITAASTLIVAKPFGTAGVSFGYLACCSVNLVLGTHIFIAKRRVWHV